MMSRIVRILLAGTAAVVFASAALTMPAAAEELRASDQGQIGFDRREVSPEDARPGGGADPFETGVVIVLNTLLLGGLLGGVLLARRRLGCTDVATPRPSV
ncbi:hypothetical protein [Nocardioides albus]|uniref:Uncharacterized protein n=1 Tax=Nocardioides albus TaxID=1841 RepID=A0A7W5FAD1_9ACTN|nr:hypothetical protein [Nocardioides albus]MBB3091163.1 hypothetical protein [Nocardioides albus]